MARTLVESPITTRASRGGLPNGLHWRGVDKDIHLGYRKSGRGGSWLVRWYTRQNRCYQRIELGTADDIIDVGTLDYGQAAKAAKHAVAKARQKLMADAEGPPLTVRAAIEEYIEICNDRASANEGREVRSKGCSNLARHVCKDKTLLNLRLDELTEKHLDDWRQSLDPKLKGATKRRIINDFKAALNSVRRRDRRRLPSDFGDTVTFGLSTAGLSLEPVELARENQILDDDMIRSIVAEASALDGDLGLLVLLLAATGARFSQLKRMKVRDVQIPLRRILIPRSRKGRNKVAGFIPLRVGADVVEALQKMIAGRKSDEPLLCRWRHVQIGPAVWRRDTRAAWQSASEMGRHWEEICRKLGLSGVVPYALRHSSIVRGIGAGLPIRLVAAMHDTSIVMIEKHYSRWIVDGLEELAARAIVPLLQHGAADSSVR